MPPSESFDVVIAGARCAGAPLATMLARRGLRVCLLDKDTFPSDTLSTHVIQPVGVQVLERIGLLESLLEVSPPMTRGRIVADDVVALVDDIPALLGAPVISVRRFVLDEILANAAAEAGAHLRTGTRVTGVVKENGRVVGVTTADGEVRASLVVGADGTSSAVAKMVDAREYHPTPNGRVFMWGYWEADPTNGEFWIGKIDDHAYLVTPTDSGLTLVAACPSIDRRDEVRTDRETVYAEGVRAWPELHAGVEGARREGPIHTMANLHGFFRRSAGPGWALVGDAGHFKDPTPGQGIADALRQCERLASTIERGLAGGAAALDEALNEWWRWRDADAWEMYWLAHDMGAAGPIPPLLLQAQRRIAEDPDLLADSSRVLNHEIQPSEVFTAGFAVRTLAGALRRGRGQRGAILREAWTLARNEARRRRLRPRGTL